MNTKTTRRVRRPVSPTRQAVVQMTRDGKGPNTIALELGISVSTVYHHLRRARDMPLLPAEPIRDEPDTFLAKFGRDLTDRAAVLNAESERIRAAREALGLDDRPA